VESSSQVSEVGHGLAVAVAVDLAGAVAVAVAVGVGVAATDGAGVKVAAGFWGLDAALPPLLGCALPP